MDAELLSRSAVGLASLRAQARALSNVEIPRLFGRGAAVTDARTKLAAARTTLTETEKLLRQVGHGPAADALRGGLVTLDNAEPTGQRLFSTGYGLEAAVDGARYRLDVDISSLMRSTLEAGPSDEAAMTQLARVAHFDEQGSILRVAAPVATPEQLVGHVAGPDDVAGARRLQADWQRQVDDANALRRDAHELVTRGETSSLAPAEVDRLLALVDSDPGGHVLRGPRTLEHGSAFSSALRMESTLAAEHPRSRADFLARWEVATLPPAEQSRVVRSILDTPTRDVTTRQWRQLQQMLEDREARFALSEAVDGRELRPLLDVSTGGLGLSAARRFHATWAVDRLDDTGRIELARRVVARSPERLTEGEWALVEALTRTEVPGPRALDDVNDLAWIARANVDRIVENPSKPWNAAPFFSAWNQQLDPTYLQRVGDAVTEVAAGRPTPEAIDLLLIERERLGALLADATPEAQRNLVSALLADPRIAPSRDSREVLEVARMGLANATDIHPDLDQLRQQTLDLIDLNLRRIAGDHPAGEVRGYSNHPDYGEVGRIRANLDLIVNASRSRSDDGRAPELLTW